MKKVKITIDNIDLLVEKNKTILEAALENNIYIPNLCYHKDLISLGACRLCMVEVDGWKNFVACKMQVEDGMKIKTETPKINIIRRINTELLLSNHDSDCIACTKNYKCELQKIASYVGIDNKSLEKYRKRKELMPKDNSNPFFSLDMNKCVLCGICIRTCDEIQGTNAIDFTFRGTETVVSTFNNKPFLESTCKSCGECVIRCPTGALSSKQQIHSYEVKTICSYCGVGCSYYAGVRGNTIVSVRGDNEGPANKGSLCVKGRYGYEFVNHPERLTHPLLKKDGKFVKATWEEALNLIAEKFSKTKSDSFACFSSARITNEENYIVQKFVRAVMGTNNIDHCARLCHAPSVAGLAQTFGSGAMTNSIDEIGKAKTIFVIGSNTTDAHPVIALQIKEAALNGSHVIVANPKRIDLCNNAELVLQHKPGTDVALIMGIIRVIRDNNLMDKKFIEQRTENFEEFNKSLDDFSIDKVEKITGVGADTIIKAAILYATAKPASILYAMGITQHSHGTDNVLAISNLALITGNIGKPNSGVNPLRGQNNVQGACDMGALPVVFPGYQKVAEETSRLKFEKAWNKKLSSEVGLTLTEIISQVEQDKIKTLYIVGENSVLSEADSSHVIKALEKIDFLVVQDIFMTATAKYADVVLPSASYAEKDGTFTNTERRVQRVRKVIEPVGEAKPDWVITCDIAKKMKEKGFDFNSPDEILDEINSLTPIYAGITWERVTKKGIQWPCPDIKHKGTKYLHADKFATPSEKGKFMPLVYKESAEIADKDYPFILTTDRSIFHYHTSTMTGHVDGLNLLNKEERLLINPVDVALLGIENMEKVKISTRRGSLTVKAKITDVCPVGVCSMTFHFEDTPTNMLTNPALDPVAKTPETKVAAAKIEKIN